ncbi:molybdopterin-guanine dinucleotide biosynthesis protein B [bacterium]|nr:molybdopterin-guanine dinucleotide biosynthesis protein B [bacterium]
MNVFGVTGWKNAGKTGLMERLVAEFCGRGLRVSTLKHAHHSFDVDHPGKDSHRHRMAGASQVLLASTERWALMNEHRGAPEPSLAALLAKLDPVDLVLIEGWKRDKHPKVEAFDLPRFLAALVTLLVGVWKGNLLLAIAAGGVTLYSMLNFGF